MTSDVTRSRTLWLVAACVAVGVAASALFAPPTGGAGAVALPHVAAKLECSSCHATMNGDATNSCKNCHGAHGLRAGHAALASQGVLTCSGCHAVHDGDQGVRFTGGTGDAVRYGVAASERVEFRHGLERDATVVLAPLARCFACHDGTAERDPIRRCMSTALEALGERAPSLCLDEHHDGRASRAPAAGVCRSQHGSDRYAAWESARAVVAVAPLPPEPRGGGHALWLSAGASFGAAGALAAAWLTARRRRLAERLVRSLDSAIAPIAPTTRRLPVIDSSTCLGCYACVDACPFDVIQVHRYVAEVVREEACCGLVLCEAACPNGSLGVLDAEGARPPSLVTEHLEARDVPGLFLAGEIAGVPLIKNAILHGTRAAERIAATLPRHPHALDVLVVGAGPAGLSAALQLKELGLRYRVIEQGSVAESIKSFPRNKLVFDQPLDLPRVGKLWLDECTKEELLAKWLRIVRTERLDIAEGHRLVSASRLGPDPADGFVARVAVGEQTVELRAARVLVAVGMRGTPRRLPFALSEAVLSKVHYHLADARSFAGQRVLVVGLGDSALETAIALARQPGTTVSVSYRGTGKGRGKRRNVDELARLVGAGRVAFFPGTTVDGITLDGVALRDDARTVQLDNDAVFVLIGSLPPRGLLAAIGVRARAAAPGESIDGIA